MVCLYCGAKTGVSNSRHQKKQNHIWRRRVCMDCGAIFTTSESPDLLKSLIVQSGKRVQPFSRDKLFLTIHDSIKHRKTAQSDATALTDTVISRLYPLIVVGSLKKEAIVQTTTEILRRFDKTAASHYKAFHPSSEV